MRDSVQDTLVSPGSYRVNRVRSLDAAAAPSSLRVFLRSSFDPNDEIAFETCKQCGKHVRHHFGSPDSATEEWPSYRCDPRPDQPDPSRPERDLTSARASRVEQLRREDDARRGLDGERPRQQTVYPPAGAPISDPGPRPIMGEGTGPWEADRGTNAVTCHSRLVGGVLCRWWGDGPAPGGVRAIDVAGHLARGRFDGWLGDICEVVSGGFGRVRSDQVSSDAWERMMAKISSAVMSPRVPSDGVIDRDLAVSIVATNIDTAIDEAFGPSARDVGPRSRSAMRDKIRSLVSKVTPIKRKGG